MITTGILRSKDLYSQMVNYIYYKYSNLSGYGALITDQGNIPLKSVSSVYLPLDNVWVLQGNAELSSQVYVNGVYMVWTLNNRPIYGITVIFNTSVPMSGTATIRIAYYITSSAIVGLDQVCATAQNYKYYDVICPL